MSSRGRKRGPPPSKEPVPSAKKKKVDKKLVQDEVQSPKKPQQKRNRLGVNSGRGIRVSPRNSAKSDAASSQSLTTDSGKIGSPNKHSTPVSKTANKTRGRPRKVIPVEEGDNSQDTQTTGTQKVRNLKGRLFNILKETEKSQPFAYGWAKKTTPYSKETDVLSNDSQDALSEEGEKSALDLSRNTLDGKGDDVKHPILDRMESNENLEPDNIEEENLADDKSECDISQDGEDNCTKLRMIPEQIEFDEDKGIDEWWSDDPTRELTLCQLWEEEKDLYDLSRENYRIPGIKDIILRKFSAILKVPRKYITFYPLK